MAKKIDLKDVPVEDLKREIRRREEEALEAEYRELPEQYYPYEATDELVVGDEDKDNFQMYYAHVDDGSEGISYLVRLDHDLFDGTDEDDHLIRNAVKHHYVTRGNAEGWTPQCYDVSVEQLGRYGMWKLIVNKPKEE